MDKTVQNAVYLGVVLLALFIGFLTGYLVFSEREYGWHGTGNMVRNAPSFVKLSADGLKVAQGMVSPCGSNEPLANHNCSIANHLRTTINQQLNSGRSVAEVREALITVYGDKILPK